jgi:hypothetical protein
MRCFSGRKGHLVAINSPEEMSFVQSVISDQPSYANDAHMNAWIGGVAEYTSSFVWDGFCGDPVKLDTGYTNWCEGEPSSSNGNSEVRVREGVTKEVFGRRSKRNQLLIHSLTAAALCGFSYSWDRVLV